MTERRRHRRYRLPVAVRVLRPETHVLRAADISAGGLYCPDAPPRRPGEVILLEIDLGPSRVFVASARVVSERGGLRLAFVSPQTTLGAELGRL
jgi:hypothetical protein